MKKISLVLISLLALQSLKAQEQQRVITTAVPFLMVAGDARSAGMADNGVATSADVFSQQWNPAKYAFALDKQGFSASYTPYLTGLANDISLGQITYYNRINERSAFAGSLRYFGLGDIQETDENGELQRILSPNELALDGSYALKLGERFSMSVAGRYIRSNLKIQSATGDAKPASSFAVDISGFYQSEEQAYSDFNGRWRMGFNIQNIGPKLSYDDDELSQSFIPTNLKLGGGFDFIFDDYNKLGVNLELTKLLVPTPLELIDYNGDGEIDSEDRGIARDKYNDIGWVEGIFTSFGDAPDGMSEELKEFTYSVGAEYMYQESFALRAGYFSESKMKGARKYFSLGAGFKYKVINVDFSYLFSASKVRNPLENTLRFSLSFAFGDKYDEY